MLDVPITLVVSNLPLLNVPTAALNFTYQLASTLPATQPVTVTATSGTPTFQIAAASTPTSWLKVSSAAGTVPNPFNVSVDPTGLTKGTFTGTITVTGVGTGNGAQQIPVNLIVTNDVVITATVGGCTIPAQNCNLSIPFQTGGTNNPTASTLQLNSSTGATLNYTATPSSSDCGGTWLLLNGGTNAVTGATSSSVLLSANTSNRGPHNLRRHGDHCRHQSSHGFGAAQQSGQASGDVDRQQYGTVGSGTGGLLLQCTGGWTGFGSQPLSLASTGSDQLNYTISFTPDLGGNWLSLNATVARLPDL